MLKGFSRDIAIYGGVDLVFKLAQFALIPVYTRVLTVAEFGVMALLQVSMLLVAALANVGINYSVQRFYFDSTVSPESRPTLISTGLAQLIVTSAIVIGLVAAAAYPVRVGLDQQYGISWVLLVVALATVFPDQLAAYTLDTSRLQFSPFRFCAISFTKNIVGLIIGLWFLLGLNMGLLGLFLGNFIGSVLAVPLGIWLVRRDIVLAFDREYFRSMLRFGAPFVFTVAGYWAFSSMDRWLLAQFGDSVQVGLFSIALKFASVMSLVITAFHQAWIPLAMRMVQENEGHRRVFSSLFNVWIFLLGIMALGLALFAEDILMVFAPPAYWPAAPALAIGAAGIALSGTTQMTSLGITIAKRSGLVATGAWLTAAVNIAGNLALIPWFGATGSAIATLFSYLFLTLYYLVWSQKLYPLPLDFGHLAYGALLIMIAVIVPLMPLGPPLAPLVMALKTGILIVAIAAPVALGLVRIGPLWQLVTRTESTKS